MELFYSTTGGPLRPRALSSARAGRAHLTDIVVLRGRLLVANRRSVLRVDPPPRDRTPDTSSVVDAHRSVIRSCQFAGNAGKGVCRAGKQQERQNESG